MKVLIVKLTVNTLPRLLSLERRAKAYIFVV